MQSHLSMTVVISKIAIVIAAMTLDVILLGYLPNLSFGQAIPFLQEADSNIVTSSRNHTIIQSNDSNNTKSEQNNKPLFTGKSNSSLHPLNNSNNNGNSDTTNTTKLLPSKVNNITTVSATITKTTNLSNTKNLDKFGISKLYPTKPNGEEWYMDMSNPTSDPRFNFNDQFKHTKGSSSDSKFIFNRNPDGSWNVASSEVRLEAYTSAGYDQSKIVTYNQRELAAKGYMQSPNDWKNVEITGYVKYNSGKSDENFDWYARGGKHTDDNKGCEGTAYKGDLYYSGNSEFGKEQSHPHGFISTDTKLNAVSPLQGKWIGFKFVMYNLPPKIGNITMTTATTANTPVKLENWINENADGKTWTKIDEKIDYGGWGKSGNRCGGTQDQIITWGGPIATFRWDNADSVDIENFSVREIQLPVPK